MRRVNVDEHSAALGDHQVPRNNNPFILVWYCNRSRCTLDAYVVVPSCLPVFIGLQASVDSDVDYFLFFVCGLLQ